MSQNYLNIYVFALFGALASTLFGIFIFYSGVSDSSYLSYMGSEIKTFYLNKSQYDLYLYGLVYCLTFGTGGATIGLAVTGYRAPNFTGVRDRFDPAVFVTGG